MSYDIEIRSKSATDAGLPREQVAAELLAFAGVTRLDSDNFVLERRDSRLHMSIGTGVWTADDEDDADEDGAPAEHVNLVCFNVPYPYLDTTGPVALEMAITLAERFTWTVFDPQSDSYVTRETIPAAMRMQRAAGETAQDVLKRASRGSPSFGQLFFEEQFNHRLISLAACVVIATAIGIWLLFQLERPREDFNAYLPWMMAFGTIALLSLKGLLQANARYRRLHRTKTKPLRGR